MPLKKTKKEISAEIAKTFARFFENSNYSCRVQWLQSPNDDDNLHQTENNISGSIAVHDESAKNARSPVKTTEKGKKSDCRKRSRTTVVENPHLLRSTRSSQRLLNAAKTIEEATDAKRVRNLKQNKDSPASADKTEEWPPDVDKHSIRDFVPSENGTIGRLALQEQHDETVQKNSPLVADANKTDLITEDSCAGMDDAASTVSGQLRRFITFYDRQESKFSIDEDKELEDLIGKPATGNDLLEEDERDASNKQCTYDRSFDVLPDAQNPMMFHVCLKIPGNGKPYNRRMIRLRNQSSVFYDGPELKRCSIPIKDYRKNYPRPNPLENIQFFAERPQKVKRLRKARCNYFRQPRRQSPVNRKKSRASKRKIGARTEIEKVAQRTSLWSAIQEAYPKEDVVPAATHEIPEATHEIPEAEATHDIPEAVQEVPKATQEIPPFASMNPTEIPAISIEEKNVSINEWLELSSQIQADNNVDVNEFLQYASLPILSDIEDEAYQLSTFLEFTSSVRTDQQIDDKAPLNTVADTTDDLCEPLDLSMKRTTPASTDTGFCNGSFSLDITSANYSSPKHTPASHVDTDVRNVYKNLCTDNYRSGATAVDSNPSTSQTVDSAIPLSMPILTTEEPLCIIEPTVEVTPDVPVTTPAKLPPETKAPEEVMAPQRTVKSTDWNFDNYSTDLDYEPSEDEDDEDDKLSNKSSHRTKSYAPSVDTDITSSIDNDINSPGDTDIIPPGDIDIIPLVNTDNITPVDTPITPPVDTETTPPVDTQIIPPVDTPITPPVDTDTTPLVDTDTTPLVAIDTTPPVTIDTTPPVAIDTTPPVAIDTTPPVAIDTTPPVAIDTTRPVTIDTTPLVAIDTTSPVAIDTTSPVAIDTTSPVAIDTTSPVAIVTTSPVAIDTTPSVAIDLRLEPRTESRNKNVNKAARNKRDTRVVTRSFSPKSLESKQFPSAPVNVVEPQPTTTQELKPEIILIKVPSLATAIQTNTVAMPSIGVRPPPDHLKQPATTDQIELLKQQVQYLLNRICFSYLADEACTENTCRKNHKLPTADEVLRKLKFFPTETVLSLYSSFIVRVRMAFINYFPAVCEIFSIRKLKSELIAAVEHCDQHNKKSFYSDIYRACIRLGMRKLEALSEIAKVSCKSTISCTYILNIIVREDPELFQQMLQDFYPLANIDSQHILSLLRHLSENPQPKLLDIFVDMFNKYSRSDISDIGPYKMIYQEIQSLASDNPQLVRRLKSIVTRDKRIDSE
ncbi:hypothetical protein HA402_012859 [Bradysia odoriphaga]|nr:hypothetical protein HA402_012859 [Bradysia odoriphaga]